MNKDITTFEAALALSGTEKEKAFFANPEMANAMEPDELAYKRIKVLTRAINTDPETKKTWEPNWNDSDQYKYFPWFEIDASEENPAGFGFSNTDYVYWITYTDCGSRLCFESREACLHALEHFKDEYIPYILIQK